MSNDHLDKETSVSAEITPTGVKASAKSRAIAAIDRLVGNVVDRWNAPMEAKTAEVRAKSNARIKMIEAIEALGLKRLESDPEFATRAIENHFGTVIRRQENKEAVMATALEDLRREPPNEEQSSSGGESLDEAFLNRFERYAEEATGEELRVKWGKVLASEIRKPGTFSAKVMRVVDELDAPTALLFEHICRHRLHNAVIKCLSGELRFADRAKLVSAGLLVEPGLSGQISQFAEIKDNSGAALWIGNFGVASAGFSQDTSIPSPKAGELAPITNGKKGPATPVYVLTEVGFAVSSILQDRQEETFTAYAERLAAFLAPAQVREYRDAGTGQFLMARVFQEAEAA